MACTTWLHSSSLTRTFLPVPCRQTPLSTTFLRFNRLCSTSRFFYSSNRTNFTVVNLAKRRDTFLSTEDRMASAADLHFEPPLKIVEYPDPLLRAGNKKIDIFDENLTKLVDEMLDVMYKTDGIGLAAPQVGINVQLMVFNPAGECGVGEEIVLVNPKVNKYSRKVVLFNEGCLSFPGIYADILRPESVKIDAQAINGARFSISLSALPARVFQHEFDHLQANTFAIYLLSFLHGNAVLNNDCETNGLEKLPADGHLIGILFFDRMTDGVPDSIREQLEALEKKYEDKTGIPSSERIEARKRRKAGVGFGKSEA